VVVMLVSEVRRVAFMVLPFRQFNRG
jgi:hypothetical protein